jgi:hypothetical protein
MRRGEAAYEHGGTTDDLARPGLGSLRASALTYFDGTVEEAASRRVDRLLIVRGRGPFARAVAERGCGASCAARFDCWARALQKWPEHDAAPDPEPGCDQQEPLWLEVGTAAATPSSTDAVLAAGDHAAILRSAHAGSPAVAAEVPDLIARDLDLDEAGGREQLGQPVGVK